MSVTERYRKAWEGFWADAPHELLAEVLHDDDGAPLWWAHAALQTNNAADSANRRRVTDFISLRTARPLVFPGCP